MPKIDSCILYIASSDEVWYIDVGEVRPVINRHNNNIHGSFGLALLGSKVVLEGEISYIGKAGDAFSIEEKMAAHVMGGGSDQDDPG